MTAKGEMMLHEKKHDDAMRQNWDRAESNRVLLENAALHVKIADLESVLEDKRRLTRELDVAMHGEKDAAKQASLCDLIRPAERLRDRIIKLEKVAEEADKYQKYMNLGGITMAFGVTPGEKLRAALAAL